MRVVLHIIGKLSSDLYDARVEQREKSGWKLLYPSRVQSGDELKLGAWYAGTRVSSDSPFPLHIVNSSDLISLRPRPKNIHPPCESQHSPDPLNCRLCRLAETDERYQSKWREASGIRVPIISSPLPSMNRNRPPSMRLGLPCYYRGDELPNYEAQRLGLSTLKMWFPCGHADRPLGQYVCGCQGCGPRCRGYALDSSEPVSGPQNVGIALGCYGLPQLAELQVRMIQKHNGNIPILLCDDGSDKIEEYEEIARGHHNVVSWPNTDRRGHYSGDLSVFEKAIRWAEANKFDVVIKLSNRFLWTRQQWAIEASQKLMDSPHAILMQNCMDSGKRLYIRSECVALKVKDWVPLLHHFVLGPLGNPTELYLWDLVHRYFGERYEPWHRLTVDRFQASPESVWHCSHPEAEYHRVAKMFDLTLDQNFSTRGWQTLPDWKRG